MPAFVEPQLCKLGRARAVAGRAGRTRSSSTAIACSCASRTARPRCARARASTGRRSSRRSPSRRRSCRTASSTARRWRWTTRRARLLGAAGGLVRREDREPGLLRLRPAVRRRRGPARPAAARAQGAPAGAARRAQGQACRPALCRALRDGGRRGAAIGLPHGPRRHRLQAARRALSLRPRRQLGQGQVPRRPRGGDRRLDQRGQASSARCWSACIAHGKTKLVYVGRVGTGFGAGRRCASCCRGCSEVESKTEPVRGRRAPAQGSRHALGAARAGGRDRVRRLDRRRQCAPGCVQGACATTSRPRRSRPRSRRSRQKAKLAEPVPKAKRARSSRRSGRRPGDGHGRADLQSRQAAVARRDDGRRSPSSSWRATTRRSATG